MIGNEKKERDNGVWFRWCRWIAGSHYDCTEVGTDVSVLRPIGCYVREPPECTSNRCSRTTTPRSRFWWWRLQPPSSHVYHQNADIPRYATPDIPPEATPIVSRSSSSRSSSKPKADLISSYVEVKTNELNLKRKWQDIDMELKKDDMELKKKVI